MTNNQTVCDPDRIQLFIERKLSDVELSALESHLSDCDDCRRQLETAVASEDLWSEMRDSLRDEQLCDERLPPPITHLHSREGQGEMEDGDSD